VRRRSDLALAGLWLAARLRLILRSPRGAFFTFVFPLILLVVFNGLNDSTVSVAGGKVDFAQFFTPAIGVFAMATGSYTALIFGLATAREQGILKRVKGTPLPMYVYLGSWLAATLLISIASVVLMFVVAVPAFDVHVYPRLLPAALVTLVIGGASLSAIALAVASFVRRTETAPIAANLTLFPLLFVSGIFYPLEGAPHWVQTVAHLFPLSHLAQAFEACFSPHTHGSGFAAGHLAVIALWGLAGAAFAVRHFDTEAEDGGERTGRRSGFALRLPGRAH
jgi:ABC-2 type transport system permease protein